jgi:hypothetical protein
MDTAATISSSDLPCSISHPLIGWIRQIMSPLHNRFSFAIVRVHSHLDLIHIIHLFNDFSVFILFRHTSQSLDV